MAFAIGLNIHMILNLLDFFFEDEKFSSVVKSYCYQQTHLPKLVLIKLVSDNDKIPAWANENYSLGHGPHLKNKLRYVLIDIAGVLGNYVPVNCHCLYDLSVLVEGFLLSLDHQNVCIICGAVETASSIQKPWDKSCPEYRPD